VTTADAQPSLFDPPAIPPAHAAATLDPHMGPAMGSHSFLRTRRPPRDTEVAAAIDALPRSGTQRGRLLAHIRACGIPCATNEEIQDALGMNPSSERPRRVELLDKYDPPLIKDSRRRRPGRSGSKAVVWVAAEIPDTAGEGAGC